MPNDPRIYKIIQEIESSNNPDAVSPKGARGLMQIMPKTGAKPGYGVTPLRNQSPEENVRFGKDYFNAMYKKYGSIELALAAYNAGPTAVDNVGGDISRLPKETREYVSKAMKKFGSNEMPTKTTGYISPQKRFKQTSEKLAETSKARNVALDTLAYKKASDNSRGIKMAEEKLTSQQRMRNTVRGDRLEKLMEEQNIRSDSPKGKEMQANTASLISLGIGVGPAMSLIRGAYIGGSAASKASGRAALKKALGQTKNVKNSEVTTFQAPVGKGKASTFLSPAEKAAGMKARTSAVKGGVGAAAIQAASSIKEDKKPTVKKPEGKDFEEEMGVGQGRKPIKTTPAQRKPAPVEEGKPGMTRAEAEEKGIVKPEGFFQDVADLIAGGKGKGTVEYDYPSDDKEKKSGGMVYRMKGGKVGKATKRGTGKAMTGAYINYGKPMKEKMSSGGKVGMRGCGKAMRGFGKAMKGK